MRLLDFFADREPWGEFWRLLGTLGSDSRYHKAMLQDPEAVALALEHENDEKPVDRRPEVESWTTSHELLAGIWDRLGAIAALVADGPVAVKRRHEHPPPYPRPVTELDRQRAAREKAKEQAYDDRLFDVVEKAKQRWREQNPDAPAPRRGA